MALVFHSSTEIGSRESNQDSFVCEPDIGLFAVADGVGGGMHGDVASKLAVELLKDLVSNGMGLKPTFHQIQSLVLKEATRLTGGYWMGTTLTALRFTSERKFELCHVGDSRAYRISPSNLEMLTEDHEIWDEDLQADVLSSYMGLSPDVGELTIFELEVELEKDESLLICSDGLYKQVAEEDIQALNTNDVEIFKALCFKASQQEKSDNVTAIWVLP